MCCMIKSEKLFIMVVKNQNSWQFENQARDIKQIFAQWKERAHQNTFNLPTKTKQACSYIISSKLSGYLARYIY